MQTLDGVNIQLSDAHHSIAAGKEVSTAQDNAALWAISELMNADISGLQSISVSFSLGEATFAGQLLDSTTRDLSSMIDTSMEEAATRYLALRAQQQLSTLSLSIVKTMPDMLRNLH